MLVVNRNNVATTVRLIPREDADARMAEGVQAVPALKTPYAVQMEPMLSPLGAPCNRPPWGALVAIDLKSRKRLWEVPLGTRATSRRSPSGSGSAYRTSAAR